MMGRMQVLQWIIVGRMLQVFSCNFANVWYLVWKGFWHHSLGCSLSLVLECDEDCRWILEEQSEMIFLFMTIFVSRQLRVTLDSIHNSCNVSIQMCNFIENILETRNKKCVGKRRLQQKVFHSSFKMGSLFRSLHHQLAVYTCSYIFRPTMIFIAPIMRVMLTTMMMYRWYQCWHLILDLPVRHWWCNWQLWGLMTYALFKTSQFGHLVVNSQMFSKMGE